MNTQKKFASTTDLLSSLKTFRQQVYASFPRCGDALFDVMDAVLRTRPQPSLPYLSLSPVHQRGHGSLYRALANGQMNAPAIRRLITSTLPESFPVYAVDLTTWARNDAETSPDRGYYYHPSRQLSGKPIAAGWSYQLLSRLRGRFGFEHRLLGLEPKES